jgi:hypothetical protein
MWRLALAAWTFMYVCAKWVYLESLSIFYHCITLLVFSCLFRFWLLIRSYVTPWEYLYVHVCMYVCMSVRVYVWHLESLVFKRHWRSSRSDKILTQFYSLVRTHTGEPLETFDHLNARKKTYLCVIKDMYILTHTSSRPLTTWMQEKRHICVWLKTCIY